MATKAKTPEQEIAAAKSTKEAAKMYVVTDKVKSLLFRAGVKATGDDVNPDWPEYKANSDLLEQHIGKGWIKEK